MRRRRLAWTAAALFVAVAGVGSYAFSGGYVEMIVLNETGRALDLSIDMTPGPEVDVHAPAPEGHIEPNGTLTVWEGKIRGPIHRLTVHEKNLADETTAQVWLTDRSWLLIEVYEETGIRVDHRTEAPAFL